MSFVVYFQSVTLKTKSKPVTQSDAESVATESCTRRGQRDVSLSAANPLKIILQQLFVFFLFILLVSLTLCFQWLCLMPDEEEKSCSVGCYCH